MSRGQLQLLKQILRAGSGTAAAPLDQLRESFERFNSKFPEVEGTSLEPVRIGELGAEWVDARLEAEAVDIERAILYLHGGGFVVGSIVSHRQLAARLSRAAGARCLVLDYRLAPESPYPAALEDALRAYRWLCEGFPPRHLAVAGDSAGAGLGVLALAQLRAAGASSPMPASLICLSPWVDYEGRSASIDLHAELDPVVRREGLERMAQLYLGGADPRNPRVTPLTADLGGLPPMLIQAGGAETLLDDARRLDERARAHGVEVDLEIWPDMIHVWHLFAGRLEEGSQAIDAAGAWAREIWRRVEPRPELTTSGRRVPYRGPNP